MNMEFQPIKTFNEECKKEILDQIEKLHKIDLPKNLVENELAMITRNLKKEEVEKHKKNNENKSNY